VAIHTNLCTCVHGCMYMCVHVWWWRWLRETLENTLTHLHKHTHTSVKELGTQKISSVRTHKCTLPRKNMLHTRRNSSSKEWKRGGGGVETYLRSARFFWMFAISAATGSHKIHVHTCHYILTCNKIQIYLIWKNQYNSVNLTGKTTTRCISKNAAEMAGIQKIQKNTRK